MIDISIITISFNTKSLLKNCLRAALLECRGLSSEIIVVDNASMDGSADMVASEFPDVRLIRNDVNLGFAAANNMAFDAAKGRYLVLLNSDAFLQPGALATLLRHMEENPKIGIGGARLTGPDGSWQPSAYSFPSLVTELISMMWLSERFPQSRIIKRLDRMWADANQPGFVDWVPGACAIIRREALEKIGKFDEKYFMYCEEVDLCRRMKNGGFLAYYWPDASAIHLCGKSAETIKNQEMCGHQLILWQTRSRLIYYRKHHGYITTWLVKEIESFWHWLTLIKNQLWTTETSEFKISWSRKKLSAFRQAWKDTKGGRISPPRPW